MDLDYLLEKKYAPYIILIFTALVVYHLIYTFSGEFGLFAHNWHNNYSRQAYSWLQGRLDIPYDRPYLEIAFFGDRMYISFPPFPSIFLLPFVFFYGYNTPDHVIALGLSLVSMVYAYKLALRILRDKKIAMFFALFLILGTNYLHISLWGAVWYLAQNMAFTLLLISIYYATTDNKRHSFVSLFALAASMGCRPFNLLYLPIIFLLIAKREDVDFKTYVRKVLVYAIPAIILGGFYMWLNYARFGNVLQFGHNFLPEHTIVDPLGHLHPSRVVRNISMMFFGVDMSYPLRHGFPHYGRTSFAFWLASPMFISYAVYHVIYVQKYKGKTLDDIIMRVIPVLVFIHIFLFSLHRTLGSRQFGSRYITDSLPIVFLGLMMLIARISQGKEHEGAPTFKPEKSTTQVDAGADVEKNALIVIDANEPERPEEVGSMPEHGSPERNHKEADTVVIQGPRPIPLYRHILYNTAPMIFGVLVNFHGTIMFLTFYFPFWH